MVDVDDPIGKSPGHQGTQDLHVAGKHNQVDFVVPQQLNLFFLLLRLGFFCDRQKMKRDAESVRNRLKIFAIADDKRNLHSEFSAFMTRKEIVDTVIIASNEKRDSGNNLREIERPSHRKFLREGSDSLFNMVRGYGEPLDFPFDAHEENAAFLIHVLIDIDNISFVLKQKVRSGSDNAGLIRAGYEKYRGRRILGMSAHVFA